METNSGLKTVWSIPTRILAMLLVVAGAAVCFLLILQGVFEPFHVVQSGSMAPEIDTGDAVVVKDADVAGIEIGQVIVFRDWENKENLVIHRVVGIEDTGYTRYFSTKGDANPDPDPVRTAAGSIVGVRWATVPRFGYIMEDLSSPLGFLGWVLFPVAGGLTLAFAHDAAERASRKRPRKRRFAPAPTAV